MGDNCAILLCFFVGGVADGYGAGSRFLSLAIKTT